MTMPLFLEMGANKQSVTFRKIADSMQKQIDYKLDPGVSHQNLTARRSRIAASMYEDGKRLQKTQNILRGMANDIEKGKLPQDLLSIGSKTDIEEIVNSYRYYATPRFDKLGIKNEAAFIHIKELLNGYNKPLDPEIEKQQQIKKLESNLLGTKIPGFFPTPQPVIERMLKLAQIDPNDYILEPSAGKGDIADAIRKFGYYYELTVLEISSTLCDILTAKGYHPLQEDFLQHKDLYDKIIMNPPFENGQDIDHVRHAYGLLKRKGILVAIMCESSFFRDNKKYVEFREWLDLVGGADTEKLESGTFTGCQAFRQTGVASRIVVIEKEN